MLQNNKIIIGLVILLVLFWLYTNQKQKKVEKFENCLAECSTNAGDGYHLDRTCYVHCKYKNMYDKIQLGQNINC